MPGSVFQTPLGPISICFELPAAISRLGLLDSLIISELVKLWLELEKCLEDIVYLPTMKPEQINESNGKFLSFFLFLFGWGRIRAERLGRLCPTTSL